MHTSTAHRSSTVEVDTKLPLGLLKVLLLESRLQPQNTKSSVFSIEILPLGEGTPQIADNPQKRPKKCQSLRFGQCRETLLLDLGCGLYKTMSPRAWIQNKFQ